MNCYHLRTNPGLEPVLAAEIAGLTAAGLTTAASVPDAAAAGLTTAASVPDAAAAGRSVWADTRTEEVPRGRRGWVAVTSPEPLPAVAFDELRTVYEVLEVAATVPVPAAATTDGDRYLAMIRDLAAEVSLPWPRPAESFAVRCLRVGNHPVNSPDVERTVGGVVAGASGARVNLSAPDVTIRADLDDDLLTIGRLLGSPTRDRRFTWAYRPRITLSTVVAAACLRLSAATDPQHPGAHPHDPALPAGAILDPFCGSGTIAIEAAARRVRDPDVPWAPVYAADIAPEAVAGTRANLAANALARAVVVRRADATALADTWVDRGIGAIVCNPPFGVRLGRRLNFDQFYRELLDGAAAVLPPGGRLVLLSSRRRGRLNHVIADRPQWWLRGVHLIEIGGVFPGIFVLERRDVGAIVRTTPGADIDPETGARAD